MVSFYSNLSAPVQAFIACLFTWGITSLGAAIVFFFKEVNKKFLDMMLALAAGIMMAASFFSLLAPAVEQAENLGLSAWLMCMLGFTFGGLFLYFGDKIFSYFTKNDNSKKRITLLVSSITLHNIPEGLAIGVAFGSIAYGLEGSTLISSVLLAVGIGLQNFPEGTAVSLPLRREGLSRTKAFLVGCLSGIVEPVAGFLGALLVLKVRFIMPILLAFAAGAMIYVVCSEIIPESQSGTRKDLMALVSVIGFVIMMVLDIALG